jgi:APA family basic amino acid/polyamine antiporter
MIGMLGTETRNRLARRLGLFDAVMIVMGGIVGSGIFMNPYIVARQVHTPALILGAWAAGGLIALAGGFIWAELAARRPQLGGQYAYLRDAYHPSVAFLYGWTLLLVTQTGGMAAVAVTFARYFLEITRAPLADWLVAVLALGALTLVNCLGVRSGSTTQNILMVLKIAAIAMLVVCGFVFIGKPHPMSGPVFDPPVSWDLLRAAGAALTPIAFSYGGWQTASFMTAELRDPRRDLTRGLIFGVLGVVVLYLSVNFVCLYALGPEGLASTTTPASAVMQAALGERGAMLIAVAIAISTLGFLSQGMLTAPRVYYAMAEDGLFFRAAGWVPKSTRVPAAAIALQGIMAIVIALSGRYEQILSYVTSSDFILFGATATCVFVFRRRDARDAGYSVPGHPWTTAAFVAVCALIVAGAVYSSPKESLVGWMIAVSGLPAYFYWRSHGAQAAKGGRNG